METVVVLGAHSAVGAAILECLEARDVSAIAATTTEHVEGGLNLIDGALVDEGDLFVVAFAGKMARGLIEGLRAKNKAVVDVANVLDDVPVVFPMLDPSAVDGLPGPVRLSPGLAEPIAGVLRSLSSFAPKRVFISTYESAAVFDRPGMDELSAQVRAVFTMQDRVNEHFGATLAFDTIPTLSSPKEDPHPHDMRLVGAIQAAVGGLEVRATRVLVPTFSADAAVLDVDVAGTPDRETVVEALRAGRGQRYVDGAPPAVDALGLDHALVGRLVVEPGRIACWVASDRLRRGSATQAAVLVERWLARANGDT